MGIKERIEALQPDCEWDCDWQDLRNRAAKEAAEADELMAEMAEGLQGLLSWCESIAGDTQFGEDAKHEEITTGEANRVLRKYNQYKEQAND